MAAWVAAGLVLFAFFLRVSFGERVDSDGANSALQAWDLAHGHLMLHGWILGDATFYAFELPLNGIVQLLFGVGNLAAHIGSALTYLIVAACAMALAVTSSRGPARVVRCAVVVAVLAAPLLAGPPILALLEEPDHIGTSLFLLVTFLLIDRVPDRRFTAPLVCLIRGPSPWSPRQGSSRCCRSPPRPRDHPSARPPRRWPRGLRRTGSRTASPGTGMPRSSRCSRATGSRSARLTCTPARTSTRPTGRRTRCGTTPSGVVSRG